MGTATGGTRGWLWAAVLALMLSCGACTWLHGNDESVVSAPPTEPPPTGFFVAAVPVYRLATSQYLLDVPSRLLVLQVRVESTGQDSFTARLQDLGIVLADGTPARVFDTARARVLLRRTLLGEADLAYTAQPDHLPGGVSAFSRAALRDMVAENLLEGGSFGPGQPLQGYVVIDTGQPLTALDGAAFELVARRLGDDMPARYARQLGPAAAPAGAMQ